jgi:uncharacterized protein involved in exopolysaccharide biosynthesis
MRIVLFLALVSGLAGYSMCQTSVPSPAHVRTSPAYAELLLQKTELESTLESLLVDYNEGHPKIKGLRTELTLLNAEILRLSVVKPADAGRLTSALGRLMLRKVELEVQFEAMRAQYKDEHPEVKKLKRKIEIYESAIREILG